MKKSKGAKAIERVAIKNGVSVAEVRREMELAIDEAISSPEPAARSFWEPYIKSGTKPTPEEFIAIVAKKAESSCPKNGMAH